MVLLLRLYYDILYLVVFQFYINPEGVQYITYKFEPISQIMRIIIAKDLNIEKYDWRQYPFAKNIIDTIKKFKIS